MDMINSGINGNIDNPVPTFDPPADAIIDAFVHKRIAKFAAQHEIAGGEGYRRAGSFLKPVRRASTSMDEGFLRMAILPMN